MGCGGAKKAKSALEINGINVEDIIALSIFDETRELVEQSLSTPDMELFD